MNAKLSEELLEKISTMAALELSNEQSMINRLECALEEIELLTELDTDGVEPLIYLWTKENSLREDEEKVSFGQEEILRNTIEQVGGYVRVPKIVT